MLVISQKKGEKLHIGRDITISILDLQSGKVRLGIEAPAAYQILRDALYDAQEAAEAAEAAKAAEAATQASQYAQTLQETPESPDSQTDKYPYPRGKSKLKAKGNAY